MINFNAQFAYEKLVSAGWFASQVRHDTAAHELIELHIYDLLKDYEFVKQIELIDHVPVMFRWIDYAVRFPNA